MKLSTHQFNELISELEKTPPVNEREWKERTGLTNDWAPVDVGIHCL